MLTKHLALVSLTDKVTVAELSQTAAALQKQVTRDLAPIWSIQATVDYFPDLKSVPFGYWPIIVTEDIKDPGAAGFHTDKHHQPFALVQFDDTWQLTCSHELCEMLIDPYGNRLESGPSLVPGQGKVNYLVEVCDPCEDASFAYSINGILVSDFYTPNYFDPQAVPGVRYSYTGALKKPLDIKRNGYISWQDPVSKKWFQATFFGGSKPVIRQLKGMESFGGSLRSQVDRLTRNTNHAASFKKAAKKHAAYKKSIVKSSEAMFFDWAEEIEKFIQPSKATSRGLVAAAIAAATATVAVTFNTGVGSLTATLHRNDGTSDVLNFGSTGGSQTFSNVSTDDNIVLNVIAAGDADINIDQPTKPSTPINIAGENTRILRIL